MENFIDKNCKKCGSQKTKKWQNLDEDQKFLAKRLLDEKDFSAEQMKKHRFCMRCFYLIENEIDYLT